MDRVRRPVNAQCNVSSPESLEFRLTNYVRVAAEEGVNVRTSFFRNSSELEIISED
jgi:hypothetical protein